MRRAVTKLVSPADGPCVRRGELGRGVAGVVYRTCCGGRCSYATKVFSATYNAARADREIKMQKMVARAGLAPPVVTRLSGCTRNECVIVMGLVSKTLRDYVRERGGLTEAEQRSIIRLLKKVADLGVDHGDTHSDNIAIEPPFRLKLIDFSEASLRKVEVWKQVAKLVGDLGTLYPRLRFGVLEAYATRGMSRRRETAATNPCADWDSFRRLVVRKIGVDMSNPKVEDLVETIWMNWEGGCDGLLAKIRTRVGVGK